MQNLKEKHSEELGILIRNHSKQSVIYYPQHDTLLPILNHAYEVKIEDKWREIDFISGKEVKCTTEKGQLVVPMYVPIRKKGSASAPRVTFSTYGYFGEPLLRNLKSTLNTYGYRIDDLVRCECGWESEWIKNSFSNQGGSLLEFHNHIGMCIVIHKYTRIEPKRDRFNHHLVFTFLPAGETVQMDIEG